MDNSSQNERFQYSYSAKQQDEIRAIRQKYQPKEETKLEQLRRLDASTTTKGMILSILVGVAGSMLLGTGMSFCMVWSDRLFIPGVVIGIAGILAISAAYPLFQYVTKKERERLAPEILKLSEELMQ